MNSKHISYSGLVSPGATFDMAFVNNLLAHIDLALYSEMPEIAAPLLEATDKLLAKFSTKEDIPRANLHSSYSYYYQQTGKFRKGIEAATKAIQFAMSNSPEPDVVRAVALNTLMMAHQSCKSNRQTVLRVATECANEVLSITILKQWQDLHLCISILRNVAEAFRKTNAHQQSKKYTELANTFESTFERRNSYSYYFKKGYIDKVLAEFKEQFIDHEKGIYWAHFESYGCILVEVRNFESHQCLPTSYKGLHVQTQYRETKVYRPNLQD